MPDSHAFFPLNTDRNLLVNLPSSDGFSGVFLRYLFQIIVDVNLFKVVSAIAKEPAVLNFSLVLFVPLYVFPLLFVTVFLSNSFDRILTESMKSAAGRGPRVRRKRGIGAAAVLRREITLTADKRTNTEKTSE